MRKKKNSELTTNQKMYLANKNLQSDYIENIDSNPQYSLEVDPLNQYSLSDADKVFVKLYVDTKNVYEVATLMGIDVVLASQMYMQPAIQAEINRIDIALYQRRFATKLLNLDAVGGYLTSMLTDAFTPSADKLRASDKLRVVDLIIKLNEIKQNALLHPEELVEKDLDTQIKELSVATIKQLLEQNKQRDKKKIIGSLDNSNALTAEDKAYLETLSTEELLKLVNETNKGGK